MTRSFPLIFDTLFISFFVSNLSYPQRLMYDGLNTTTTSGRLEREAEWRNQFRNFSIM